MQTASTEQPLYRHNESHDGVVFTSPTYELPICRTPERVNSQSREREREEETRTQEHNGDSLTIYDEMRL